MPELRKIIRLERYLFWLGPLFFGLLSVMGISLIFDNPERPWLSVLGTALFLGTAIWYVVWIPRRRKKIQKLLAQLP